MTKNDVEDTLGTWQSISRDGRRIVFDRRPPPIWGPEGYGVNWDVFTMNVTDEAGKEKQMTSAYGEDVGAGISFDGNTIAFASGRFHVGEPWDLEIFAMNFTDSPGQEFQVSDDTTYLDGSVSISGDGKTIAWHTGPDTPLKHAEYITIANISDKSHIEYTIIDTPEWDMYPTLSSDGKKVCFMQFTDQINLGVFIANTDGTGITRIPGALGQGVISGDGSKVAVLYNDGDGEFSVYDTASGNLIFATNNNVDDWFGSINYHGNIVAYTRDGEIYTYDLQTMQETRLTNDACEDWYPRLDEDGDTIAFVSIGRDGPDSEIFVMSKTPANLDPWEYCPYVYLDYGCGFPWDTTSDLPVNVLYTGTYFWGDLRVIQYWFHWDVDYMWWLKGFVNAAYKYKEEGWTNPLRQTAKQQDWEPIFVAVNEQGLLDSILVRWHYWWIKYDLTVGGAELLHPAYQNTHVRLWFSIGSHTPLSWHFAFTTPVLLKIAGLIAPPPFDKLVGLVGTYAQPPLYSFQDQGTTYPCGMESWNEDLASSLGFDPVDLQYVNNPTLAYAKILHPPTLSVSIGCPANILVTAPNGLRVGYDPFTGDPVNEIDGATYSGLGTDPQMVNIPSPLSGVYDIKAFGTGSGAYTITIHNVAANGSITGTETYTGVTDEGDVDCYSASISEAGEMEAVSWEHVFEDVKQGTMLKISTDDKYFQFTAPEKEFSIKEACNMRVCKHSILIWHKDNEIELVTTAIDTRVDFCFAYAKDVQTGKRYFLIDKPGMEK
jgi:Tol biopolymer transport system component